MDIYIEDKILKYENDVKEISNILKEIDIIMEENSKIINYLLIDGLEIFENYYEYLSNNIKKIEKVRVISHTYKELVNDILKSTWLYIEKIPAGIENLTNNFYKNPQGQDWQDLNDFMGGLSWMMGTCSTIDQDPRLKDVVSSYEFWNIYAQEVIALVEVLPDFEEALSSKDNITIADILSYEILPILKNMAQSLLKLVDVEVALDELN